MRYDKDSAIKLRKNGKSYNEISILLNIPKSTLSGWFSKEKWSIETKEYLAEIARTNSSERMTIISHDRRDSLKMDYQSIKSMAEKQFAVYSKEKLFIAGLMIYWGEGDSKLMNGRIRITNSDPLMLKLFYKFIKKYLPEISDKAQIYLVLYPDLDDKTCRNHWSAIVGLPVEKFINSSYIKGNHPTKRLEYGIGTLAIANRLYKEKIITWVDMIKKLKI